MRKPEEGLAEIDNWRKNFYIVGGTQSGKTTFMIYLAYQQMLDDCALIVIDPHGELAPKIATLADKERLVYVDVNNPLVVNPLDRDYSLSEIAEEFAGAINASVTVNAPQQVNITVKMSRILHSALEVFSRKHFDNSYLIDFLDSFSVRQQHFQSVHKSDFWIKYDSTKGMEGQELRLSGSRITDRLTLLQKDDVVKKFLNGDDEFNIDEIVKKRKIVCFNLEHIMPKARHYIGNLITYAIKTYINKADLSTPRLGVYVDEFHSFINETFDSSLVECLKRGVNFVLAHQSHAQVLPATVDIALGNSQVVVALDVGDTEAKKMLYKYPGLKKDDLINIEKFHAYISIHKNPHYVACYYKKIRDHIPGSKTPAKQVNFFKNGIIKV